MQEKVQPSPPPAINIVKGSPPPNSWVSENIVQYLQGQSQVSFLTDIIAYVQTLQSQQMMQARPRALEMKDGFAALPEGGSEEDIANTTTYNATQGYVKTQIQFLQNMVANLQQGNASLAPQLNAMASELTQTAQSFPHLAPQQLQNLNTLLQQLTTLAKSLPPSAQKSFWNSQVMMLKSMMGNNQGNMQDLQDEINTLQGRTQQLSQLTQLLQTIKSALTATPPTTQQFQNLIVNLQTLANQSGQLNPDQQQALGALFQQLNQFKTNKGQTLSQLIADDLVQGQVSSFLQSNPQATPAQVTAFLKSFLQQSNLQSSPLPFMQSLGNSIEDLLDKSGFPVCEGFSGEPFATATGGKISTNEEVLSQILSAYAPTTSSAAGLSKSVDGLTNSAGQEINSNQTTMKGLTTTLTALQGTQDQFGKAAAWSIVQSYSAGQRPATTGLGATPPSVGAAAPPGAPAPSAAGGQQSLPNEFANAILNHYMPQQNAYLETLAMFLFLDNMGAGFGNTLMNDTSDYAEAAYNYDFNHSLTGAAAGPNPPGIPNFSGSEANAKQQLSNERAQCSTDIHNANNAINHIQSQLNQINSELGKNPTASQAKILNQMKSSLTNTLNNLQTAISQLTSLQGYLNSISVGPPTGSGQTSATNFGIYSASGGAPPTGWQTNIGNAEYQVINGNPAAQYPGGLLQISTMITTFQQNYSDQGQNQQMQLQMVMTEIQQEWTIVSTAMQMINQMYMTVAQAIYK